MRKTKQLIFVVIQVCTVSVLRAQVDPHFSQYYAYPLWLNPALTGVIDGDKRINANFKDQWAGINNGYRTGGLSMDFRQGDKMGIGVNLINQAAGTAGYNYFAAYGSFGYGISVSGDGTKKLHFGLQAGFINRSFDAGKLQLDEQYNPVTGYDPNAPITEAFTTTNALVFDASAGIFFYDGDPQQTANIFAGFSAAHLTAPKDPFVTGSVNSRLPIRFTANAGVKIHASEALDLTPHTLYIRQQQNTIAALGIYSELKFDEGTGLIFGGMYRLHDAAVVDVGYHLKTTLIGISYDFNTSALRNATNGSGGLELSLSYIFPKMNISNTNVLPGF